MWVKKERFIDQYDIIDGTRDRHPDRDVTDDFGKHDNNSPPPGIGALGSIANCKQIADLGPALEQALQGTNGDVQKELAVLQAFAAKTPAAIRPDFQTIVTAFTKVAGALRGVNLSSGQTPDAATIAKLAALATQLNSPAFTAAAAHIDAWAKTNCHP